MHLWQKANLSWAKKNASLLQPEALQASGGKTPRTSLKSTSKKQSKGKASPAATIEVFRIQGLTESGSNAFMCRITNMITPKAISRIGNKWYAAVNKGNLGSMLRTALLTGNISDYYIIYD